jgi:fumarylacetoacetase
MFFDGSSLRSGVAIGDFVLDLGALVASGILADEECAIVRVAVAPTLNRYLAQSSATHVSFRHIIFDALSSGHAAESHASSLLVDQGAVTFSLPADIGDYTDFFAGIHHAQNAGRMFRPDNPLLPNYKHVPIAYHGRSSTIHASGRPLVRPFGQRVVHGSAAPEFSRTERLDFELELAMWIGGRSEAGSPIPIHEASNAIAGFGLLNDWSARDIQSWETQPLGPFLGKNFLTTVSPFIVTTQALSPFRAAQATRPADDPRPLPYLYSDTDQSEGAIDLKLEVYLTTELMRERGVAPHRLTRASSLDLYWTPAQLVAHHTSNGCNLRAGDLFGSGTVSSPGSDGNGSLLELTSGGREAFSLPTRETRTFLEDGDEVIIRGWCERDGYARIGFGECRGVVVAADSDLAR